MKKILLIVAVAFLISGCNKLKALNFSSKNSSVSKNTKEEQKSPFEINESEYKTYGKLRPYYELGYDDNKHAFLTDTHNKIQIVFMCKEFGCYVKEDFLTHYDAAIKEDRNLEDAFSGIIEWCIERASKQETVRSKHFKSDIERYYILYEVAYCNFHI